MATNGFLFNDVFAPKSKFFKVVVSQFHEYYVCAGDGQEAEAMATAFLEGGVGDESLVFDESLVSYSALDHDATVREEYTREQLVVECGESCVKEWETKYEKLLVAITIVQAVHQAQQG